MERFHVFIDEYGDPSLKVENDGVSSAYVVAAFCVREKNLELALSVAENIRRGHFQEGEMKSSTIAGDSGRRVKLINDLKGLPGYVIALFVDKHAIKSSVGLRHKKSFIKYFSSNLIDRVSVVPGGAEIVLDKHGTTRFQEEVVAYLKKKFAGDLFPSNMSFRYEDSKSSVLIQVADIYAGSLGRSLDPKKSDSSSAVILESMSKVVSLTSWPDHVGFPNSPPVSENSGHDEAIRYACIERVRRYVTSNSDSSDFDTRARVVFLEILLSSQAWGDDGEYIPTAKLIDEMSNRLGEAMSEHKFRSSVIAKLRDDDVVISSGPKGYRIPTCSKDLKEFVFFASSIVVPLLARVKRAHNASMEATLGDMDILASDDLASLRALVGALTN